MHDKVQKCWCVNVCLWHYCLCSVCFKMEPVRKSSRFKPELVAAPAITVGSTEMRTTIISTSNATRAKKEKSVSLWKLSDESLEHCLFDVNSLHRIRQCAKKSLLLWSIVLWGSEVKQKIEDDDYQSDKGLSRWWEKANERRSWKAQSDFTCSWEKNHWGGGRWPARRIKWLTVQLGWQVGRKLWYMHRHTTCE